MAGIVVRIGADARELHDALRGSRKALKNLGRQMDQNITQAAKYGAAAAAAGAAITAGLTIRGLAAVDAQAKLAKQLNTTSASMATISRAGELSGISIEKINASATRLTRRLSLAEAGAGPAADAIERLGLNAAEVAELPLDERIATVNRAINEMIPAAEQAGVATQLFGEEAGIAMRSLDATVIAQAREEAERFGTAISDIDAAKVEQANDAFSQMGLVVEGVQSRLAVSLADTITAVSNQLAKEFGDSSDSMQEGIDDAVESAVEGFADIIEGAADVADFISGNVIMSQFGLLGYVILGPKGALIGSAIGATFDMIEEGLSKFGVGISENEDNARKLVNVQEEIARQTEIIGKAAEMNHGKQSQFVQEANAELERLRDTEQALMREVQSSSEAQAIYNDILNKGTENATGMTGAMRRLAEAMRESLGPEDGRGTNTPGRPTDESDEEPNRLTPDKIKEREEQNREAQAEEDEKRIEQRKRLMERMQALEQNANQNMVEQAKNQARLREEVENDMWNSLTSLMNSGSKKLFQIGKVSAIAESMMSTYKGATKALELGWPMGPIAAAAITTAGFANVARIKSQSFNGGGGGGGATTANIAQSQQGIQEQQTQRSVNIDVALAGGDTRDRSNIEGVISAINEAAERGERINRIALA